MKTKHIDTEDILLFLLLIASLFYKKKAKVEVIKESKQAKPQQEHQTPQTQPIDPESYERQFDKKLV